MTNANKQIKKSFLVSRKLITMILTAGCLVFIGCSDRPDKPPSGDLQFPPNQDVPIPFKFKEFGIKEELKGVTLIQKNTKPKFVDLDGNFVKHCGIVDKNGKLKETDKKRCRFKGRLTHISTITVFVVKGTYTKYCRAGAKVYPC